jgi:hypothetical protein
MFKLFVIAESGDIYAGVPRGFKHGHALGGCDLFVVYGQGDFTHYCLPRFIFDLPSN